MVPFVAFLSIIAVPHQLVNKPALTVFAQQALSPTVRVCVGGKIVKEEPNDIVAYQENARLWMERKVGEKWTRTAITRLPEDSWDKTELYVRDFDRDGKLEIAVCGVQECATRTPTTILVYRWAGKRFRFIGKIESDSSHDIGDRDHDGISEIESFNDVSNEEFHELRYWPTFRAIQGNRFIRVNSKFPETYREERLSLLQKLIKQPYADSLLWAYYGLCVKYGHTRETPRHAYLYVVKKATEWLKKHANSDPQTRDSTIRLMIADLKDLARKNEPFPHVASVSHWQR